MCNQKINNRVFRDQYRIVFLAIPVMMLLLSVTFVQSAASKELTGIVKETPGIAWPVGTWMVEDKKVVVTEQTVIKGDQAKAHFGAKVTVKGSRVDGVFVANEFEIRTDDDLMFANK
ncbi:MAG: hypothetical protein D3925_12910 [Candidatus Electrothrix sp. AR5]|nr:hypothetical protein [Candidatus Electrothrix sp. AR5]